MNYTESLAYLDSLGKFGIKLGMERIEGLLRELGNQIGRASCRERV